MPVHVPDDGALSARLVLIGEAPGKHEEANGRPFVGPSGGKLAYWWRLVGLTRDDFYITNVVPYRPEAIDRIPREEMEEHIRNLHMRLAKLDEPWIIVPTGNYALYALTGKGKVSWHKKDGRLVRPGIMDWRGSILGYEMVNLDGSTRVVKVIPTIHPAHVLREPYLERRAIGDWQRIRDDSETPELRLPVRNHHIKPTLEELHHFVAAAIAAGKPLSIDIETPKGKVTEFQMLDGSWQSGVAKADEVAVARYKSGKKKGQLKMRQRPGRSYIGCIGFAYSVRFSLTVPLTLDYWKHPERLAAAKRLVTTLLDSPLPKVMQNGMFDAAWLRREGYPLHGWVWDTRAMHHALDPRDDHDLAYMASTLTRQPFWKHEAKDPEEITKYASNSEALWSYNGIDVCVTLEIFYILRDRLVERGLDDFYREHYAEMIPALLEMTMHGIAIDDKRRAKELDVLEERAAVLMGDIKDTAGLSLVARKGLSNDRLKFLLYGARGFEGTRAEASYAKLAEAYPEVVPLNLPPIRKKNTKGGRSITCDEVAIRKLVLKYPKQLGKLGPMLLEFRRNRKMAEFLDGKAIDRDGRMRCMYSFCTEAGRLASSSVPWGTGRNLQNIDRELRYVFIPDEEGDNVRTKD